MLVLFACFNVVTYTTDDDDDDDDKVGTETCLSYTINSNYDTTQFVLCNMKVPELQHEGVAKKQDAIH
jgi:hypothetical protein